MHSPSREGLRATRPAAERRPLYALLVGGVLIALAAALISVHVTVFALDESLIQQSALRYASNLPSSLIHDVDARATDRLYSLVLSIAYRVTGGTTAVRIDHVISVVLFVSALAPIYLMARRVLDSRWAAVGAALLSIAVPWLTLTSALFTENLSYPLFWWLVLAVCEAVWRPSPGRDLLALVTMGLLIGTRVQFAAMFPGYVLCVLAVCLWRASSGGWARRTVGALVEAARRFPFTTAVLLAAAAVLAYARFSGEWYDHVHRLLGGYSNVIIRSGLPPNIPEGLFVELIALGLGVGLLPALVSVPWYARELARPVPSRRWIYLAVSGVVLIVFLVLTVYSQGGYLGADTEERYFFYVIPAFWIGAFAALADGRLSGRALLLWALVMAVLFATIRFLPTLTEETAFLAPVESIVPRLLGQLALALLTLAAAALTWLVWSRRRGWRAWWTIGLGAAVQLSIAGYAFAAIDGQVAGVQGRTSGSYASLGWVDSHAGSHTVTWLENLATLQPPALDLSAAGLASDQVHVTLFWNSQMRNTATVPGVDASPLEFPLTGLPEEGPFRVRPGDATLQPADKAARLQEIVGESASPFLQLAGSVQAVSPDRFLALTKLYRPVRASWMTEGLEPNGWIVAGRPVSLHAWPTRSEAGSATPLEVAIALTAPRPPREGEAIHTAVLVHIGRLRREVELVSGAAPAVIELTTCLPPGTSVLTGSLQARESVQIGGLSVAGVLQAATVTQPDACPPRP